MQQLIEQLKQAAENYGVPMVLHTEHPDNSCAGFAHTVSHRRCTREVLALAYAVTGSPAQGELLLNGAPSPTVTEFNRKQAYAEQLDPIVKQIASECNETGAAMYLYAQLTVDTAVCMASHPPATDVARLFDTVRGRQNAIH